MSTFITKIFEKFFDEASQSRNIMDKSKFYLLVEHIDNSQLDNEVEETLDSIFTHLAKTWKHLTDGLQTLQPHRWWNQNH